MLNYSTQLHQLIQQAMQEDIGSGDYSTLSCIPENKMGKAALHIKQDCIIAGIDVAKTILEQHTTQVKFNQFKQDGEWVNNKEIAFEVTAPIHSLLSCERLLLNCMQRMSGIATLTHQYTKKLKGYNTQLLDTRKTTPNFRLLEKQAVKIGGGVNHRFGLYDMIMLKDNHIDYCGGIEKAVDLAYQYVINNNLNIDIEVETRNINDVKIIAKKCVGKVKRIMLDNYAPAQIVEALQLINNQFETEASGGINIDNIESYAATGVDFISVGSLIHQAVSIDLSFKAVMG